MSGKCVSEWCVHLVMALQIIQGVSPLLTQCLLGKAPGLSLTQNGDNWWLTKDGWPSCTIAVLYKCQKIWPIKSSKLILWFLNPKTISCWNGSHQVSLQCCLNSFPLNNQWIRLSCDPFFPQAIAFSCLSFIHGSLEGLSRQEWLGSLIPWPSNGY